VDWEVKTVLSDSHTHDAVKVRRHAPISPDRRRKPGSIPAGTTNVYANNLHTDLE